MGLPPTGEDAYNNGAARKANGAGSSPNSHSSGSTSPRHLGVVPTTPGSRSSNMIAQDSSKASIMHPEHYNVMDQDAMKSRSSRAVSNSQMKFANKSIFARIAYDKRFENLTLAIVCVNAIWIGVDTDWNHKSMVDENGKLPLQPASDIVEHIFCAYFTFDVVVRFLAFKDKCHFWRDGWFVFDAILVTFMVVETWILLLVEALMDSGNSSDFLGNFSVLRLLRLARLTRMARLMRQVPELVTLCKGIASATKAVCWILGFLVCVMYVFGIIMCGFIENEDDPDKETANHMFGTLGDAMLSLFTLGVLGDNMFSCWMSLVDWHNGEFESYAMQWLYFAFFCMSSLTLLNMLIGVLCEVITQTADSENDGRMENELRWCIEDAFDNMDLDMDGHICEKEWARIKDNESVRSSLDKLGVDEDYFEVRLDQMQEILFHKQFGTIAAVRSHEQERLSIDAASDIKVTPRDMGKDKGIKMDQLINKVVEIRPDKAASALDVAMLQSIIKHQDKRNQKRLRAIQESVAQMCRVRGVDPTLTPRGSRVSAMPRGSNIRQSDWGAGRETTMSAVDAIDAPPGKGTKLGHPAPVRESHLTADFQPVGSRGNLHSGKGPMTPSSANHGAKWAAPVTPKGGVKAGTTFSSVMPLTPAPPDTLKVLDEPSAPEGEPNLLMRPADAGSIPNLRNAPMEQLLEVIKRRDPSMLKGLPSTPSSASQRSDHIGQQCPELLVEPSNHPRSTDLN